MTSFLIPDAVALNRLCSSVWGSPVGEDEQKGRILDHGRVVKAIQEASGISAVAEISERQARRLKPHIEEVTQDIREAISDGVEPNVTVNEAIVQMESP